VEPDGSPHVSSLPSTLPSRLETPRRAADEQLAIADAAAPLCDGAGFLSDFYCVHSWEDAPHLKRAALQRWAEAWEGEHGRPPHVWLDALCLDPSLSAEERLAHTPALMGRSRQLLLLCGATVTQRSWCVWELYCWRMMGGSLEKIVMLPLAFSPADGVRLEDSNSRAATADSFLSFRTSRARASDAPTQETLERVIELATASRVEELIAKAIGPAVERACGDHCGRATTTDAKSASRSM
jgi:hypothetical protein